MEEWYYTKDGQQQGPVNLETLRGMAQNGSLNPEDMVWNSSMSDWTPASEVDGIFSRAIGESTPPSAPQAEGTGGGEGVPASDGGQGQEIAPGSDPIQIGSCISRGFQLTLSNFGGLFVVGLVYVVIMILISVMMAVVDQALGLGGQQQVIEFGGQQFRSEGPQPSMFNQLVVNLVAIFLSIGATRILLNVVDGREFNAGMLFEGGPYFIRALLAALLIVAVAFVSGLIIGVSLIISKALVALLFLAGLIIWTYLWLRYGFYLFAIVDKDLGVIESFQYSSRITTNQRFNLFLLSIVMFFVMLAGFLALVIGLIVAIPAIMLAWAVAFRWMQYGSRVADK